MAKNLLEYQGHLNSDVRVQLNELLHFVATTNLARHKNLKSLVGIALELLDNAYRHSSARDVEFMWQVQNGLLTVTIRNKANKQNAERLRSAVNEISTMTPDSVDAEFKRKLVQEGFGENGGAGLGMLQIARKRNRTIRADIKLVRNDVYLCESSVQTQLDVMA